jgi:hypothetical protein
VGPDQSPARLRVRKNPLFGEMSFASRHEFCQQNLKLCINSVLAITNLNPSRVLHSHSLTLRGRTGAVRSRQVLIVGMEYSVLCRSKGTRQQSQPSQHSPPIYAMEQQTLPPAATLPPLVHPGMYRGRTPCSAEGGKNNPLFGWKNYAHPLS